MKTKKIIIGSTLLLALGGAAYYFLKKSFESSDSTVPAPASKGVIPGATVPSPTQPTAMFPPGTLIQAGEGKVWLINERGERQWITSGKKWQSMGYKHSDIVKVDSSVPGMIPRGSDISGII